MTNVTKKKIKKWFFDFNRLKSNPKVFKKLRRLKDKQIFWMVKNAPCSFTDLQTQFVRVFFLMNFFNRIVYSLLSTLTPFFVLIFFILFWALKKLP